MAMTTQNKWIIGIVSFLGLAVLTRKWWMPKDGITLDTKQDTVASSGGDASDTDAIGQQYTLLTAYKAMNTKTMKNVDFKGADKNNTGTIFVKKADRNGSNINMQDAIKVFVAPSGTDEYVIPVTILKKSGGGASTSSGNKDAQVVKLFADMASNPPKTQAEAEARAAKYGVTRADVAAYNAKQSK